MFFNRGFLHIDLSQEKYNPGPYLINQDNCLASFKYLKQHTSTFEKPTLAIFKAEFLNNTLIEIQLELLPVANSNLVGAKIRILGELSNLNIFEKQEIQQLLDLCDRTLKQLNIFEIPTEQSSTKDTSNKIES